MIYRKTNILSFWGIVILSCLTAVSALSQTVPIRFPDLRFSQSAELRSVVRLPNGKYIIAGDFVAVNDIDRNNIARLNADGTVDLTWNPSIDGIVRTVVADDEHVYAIGGFTSVRGVARQGLVKIPLAGDGSPDPLWNPMGVNLSPGGSGALLIVDGQLLAAFTQVGAGDRMIGVIEMSDGTLGQVIDFPGNFFPHVIARDGDHVYVGGRDDSPGGGTQGAVSVFRYSIPLGFEEDSAWFVELVAEQGRPQVRDLAFDNGFVYVGGYFSGHVQGERRNLCRVSKFTNSLDPWLLGVASSGSPGQPTVQAPAPVNALLFADGVLHVGGSFDAVALPDGSLTQPGSFANHVTFAPDPTGVVNIGPSASVDAPIWDLEAGSNNIVAVGRFGNWEGDAALSIARYFDSGGRPDRLFRCGVQGDPGLIHAFARQPDGKLILGGQFRAVGSLSRQNLARLNADGTLDATWAPRVGASPGSAQRAEVSSLAIDGKHVYVGGRFGQVNGSDRSSLARLSYVEGDHLDQTWEPSVRKTVNNVPEQESVNGIALGPNGMDLYVSGDFSEINGVPRISLAKLSVANGFPDQSWSSDHLGEPPSAITVAPDGSVFVGGVTDFQGSGRNGVVKVDGLNGEIDTMWNPDFGGNQEAVRSLLIADGDLFIAGDFSQVNGQAHAGVTKLKAATGAVDPVFDLATSFPTTNRRVWSLSLSDKAVCGFFTGDGANGPAEAMIVFDRVTGGNSRQFDVFAPNSRPKSTSFLGGFLVPNIVRAGEDPRSASLQMLLSLRPPVIRFDQQVQRFFLEPSPEDPIGVTHFQITAITGGTLELPEGKPVFVGDYISIEQGAEGLIWLPDPSSGSREGEESGEGVEAAGAVEEGGEGTGSESSGGEPGPTSTVFRLSESSYEVDESGSSLAITVEMTGPGAESIDYTLTSGTAVPFTGSGDYFSTSGTLNFTSEGTQQIFVGIFNDTDLEGDEAFTVELSSPTGSAILAGPSSSPVTIIDDDILGSSGSSIAMTDPAPVDPGPSLGVLEINLSGDGDLGAWRLVGEDTWRDSSDDAGIPASGLSTGNYVVEFRPGDGFLEPSALTIPVDGSTSTPVIGAGVYASVGLFSTGVASISAVLEPSTLAAEAVEADRAQWRRQGEGAWRDTGDVITGLTPGLHIVEFKPVSGRVTPTDRLVYAQADQTNSTTAVYLYETDLIGAAQPAVLDFTPASPADPAVKSSPYQFSGQIYTEQGYGSGVVTKEHTVLTAAHVLFDDTTLAHVNDVYWFHQRHRGDHDLPPVQPRGWYRFEGYATQRDADVVDPSYGPGVGSLASQNLDAAAMYFLSSAGRGGSSGYLASNDTSTNGWLISSRDKLLVGYPMEGINPDDRGKMFATSVGNDTYTHLQNYVFKTTDYKTAPGGSGGAVFVRADDGELYPAAIYLGGTGDSTVRAIDDTVVDLMNRAETAGSGGGNSTGGGATYTNPGTTEDGFSLGGVTTMTTGTEVGAWRVVDADGGPLTNYLESGELLTMPPGDLNIEFGEVLGMVAPSARAASVYSSQITLVEATYIQTMASWTEEHLTEEGVVSEDGPLDDYDEDSLVHLIERAFNLSPTAPDFSILTPESGTAGLPSITVRDLGSGERLTVEYLRLKSTVATDLIYTPGFADDLSGGFTASTMSEKVTEIDFLWERVIIQDDFTTSERPLRFARVNVELVTP